MSHPLKVLVVEDSEGDAALIARLLEKADYEVQWQRIETADHMREALARQPWDVVISDYHLPQFEAPAALALLQEAGLDIPFIVVSGTIGEETAAALMKAGAQDYLKKENLARLAPAVGREIAEARDRALRRQTEAALRESETAQRFKWRSRRSRSITKARTVLSRLHATSPSASGPRPRSRSRWRSCAAGTRRLSAASRGSWSSSGK